MSTMNTIVLQRLCDCFFNVGLVILAIMRTLGFHLTNRLLVKFMVEYFACCSSVYDDVITLVLRDRLVMSLLHVVTTMRIGDHTYICY
ncbi:hypothetical protein L9F63_019196, partial [Diploptera punctata]